jgi:hypothetical protein
MLLAALLALLAVLLSWRAGYFGGSGPSPAKGPRATASGAAREGAADWDGLTRLAGRASRAGDVDLFSRAAASPPKARASARAPQPPPPPMEPVPAPPPPASPPPPPPPEDPLADVRKDLASYRFVGYLQKTGDMIVFLAAGNDVFLVKKGDVLGRTRTVVVREIKEGEIVFLFPPDKRIRATLKDNAPLTVN